MFMVLLVAAVAAALVLSSVSRVMGGVAGVIICLGVGAWGLFQMEQGKVVAFMGQPLDKPLFLGFVAVLTLYNAFQAARGLMARRRGKS